MQDRYDGCMVYSMVAHDSKIFNKNGSRIARESEEGWHLTVCSRRNGLYCSGGNALNETQGGSVKTAGSYVRTDNTQAFLAAGSKPAWGSDRPLFFRAGSLMFK